MYSSGESLQEFRDSGSLAAMQRVVFDLIRAYPGSTARELAVKGGHPDPNAVRPRIVELRAAGHIEEAGIRRCTVTGRTVMGWREKTYEPQGRLF